MKNNNNNYTKKKHNTYIHLNRIIESILIEYDIFQ